MKIAYIGIDLFFCALQSLVNFGCEVVEIFTCETDNKTEFNVKICGFAKEHGVPCKMERITKDDILRLKNKGVDFVVCGGYYFRIPWNSELPIVNIHPSLLPVGRGSWPMPQTILKGLGKSGVTVHKIAEGFDEGDILLQREFEVDKMETHQSFMEKVCGFIPEMMGNLVRDFHSLWGNAKPQGQGDYWSAPTRADFTVNENMTVEEADLILRAFFGYECIYEGEVGHFEVIGGRAKHGTSEGALPLKDGYIDVENKKRLD